MAETEYEQKWSKRAKKKGWFNIKIIQCSKNGMPDRQFFKDGKVFFVEFKSETGELSPLQEYRIAQLRKLKFHVLVINAPNTV